MGSITLKSIGETQTDKQYPDTARYDITNHRAGWLRYEDGTHTVSLSDKKIWIWYEVPAWLKQGYEVTSVTLSSRKYFANYCDTSPAKWDIKSYTGVLAWYGAYHMDSAPYTSLTFNNCEALTGHNPTNYFGGYSMSAGNVAANEYYNVSLNPSALGINNSKKYLCLVINGYRTSENGIYYELSNYSNVTSLTINYAKIAPDAKITSYPTSLSTTHTGDIRWSYSSELSNKQAKYRIEYSTNAGSTWSLLTEQSDDSTSYTIPADRFSAGNVYFRVIVTDTAGNVSAPSNNAIINYHIPRPEIELGDWTIKTLNRASTLPISWSFHSDDGYKQVQYTIEWSSNNGSSWTTITADTNEQFYTFGVNAFPAGNILLRIKVKDSHNLESEWVQKSFTVYNQVPIVTAGYPNGVTVNNSNIIIFTWSFIEEINRGQKSFELKYSSDNEATWTTIKENTSHQYYQFPAETFDVGEIIWQIRATDIDGNISSWNKASFITIGRTAAPEITEVTNETTPTVKWTISGQDCFEVNIRDTNNNLIYESQLQIGEDVREFTVPMMLDNGEYVAEVRVLNKFGYYTEWGTLSFRIDLPKPEAPSNIFVYLDSDMAINIDGDAVEGLVTYAIRRDEETGEIKILDKYIGNTIKDYTPALGHTYSYTLRSFGGKTAGYSDGEWIVINIPLDGHVLLHNDNAREIFVDLFKSTENNFNVAVSDSFNKNYRFTIGRRYPVVERTEWNTSTRKFAAWVSESDLVKLQNMHNVNVYYRGVNEAFLADMSFTVGETYVNGGRMVSIELTRIEENEVNVLWI